MADKTLTFDIVGNDRASKVFDKVGSSAEETGKKFEGTAEGADQVASKGAQAAGALSGLGSLMGGKFGAAMVVGGTAMQAAADAGDLVNAAIEGGGKLAAKAVNGVKALGKAETYAAAAKKVSAGAQWLLNAAMEANPIGLIIVAIVALVAAFVIAYKKSETFRAIVNGLFGKLKEFGGFLKGVLVKAIHGVVVAFDAVKKGVSNAVGWVVGFVKSHWVLLIALMTGPLGIAVAVIIKKFGAIKAFIGNVMGAIRGIVSNLWGGVMSILRNGADAIVGGIRALPGRIRGLGGAFASAGRAVIGAMVSGLRNASGVISGIAGNVWGAVRGLLNGAISRINSALNFTIHLPGPDINVHGGVIPHLFATGGIVTKPTLGIVGEAGPEAVIPLSKMRNTGGNGGVQIIIQGALDPIQTARQIQKVLKQYSRTTGVSLELA